MSAAIREVRMEVPVVNRESIRTVERRLGRCGCTLLENDKFAYWAAAVAAAAAAVAASITVASVALIIIAHHLVRKVLRKSTTAQFLTERRRASSFSYSHN